MQTLKKILNRLAYWALMATALTPLVIDRHIFFPYAFAKALWFRGFVTLALLAVCAGYLLQSFRALPTGRQAGRGISRMSAGKDFSDLPRNDRWASMLRHPVVIALFLFLISLCISAALAPNGYRAFWGEMERTEGVFGMLYYYVFFFLLLHVFDPAKRTEAWLRYFQASLAVAAILSIYAVFEFAGWTWIPFARPPAPRPGSFIGNSAFLAVYLLFTLIFSGLVHRLSSSKAWQRAAIVIGTGAAAVIFLTGTRGVILGLGAGVALWLAIVAVRPARANERRFALLALMLVLVLGSVFLATRTSPFWQHIPGLNRLASTAALDPNDPSTQTRLLTWKVSWEAFKERPFFGWGPENYLYAWERHYDPKYALYGETWLDRAHNKAFDLLVMQGGAGLLAYLGILAALFVALAKRGVPGSRLAAAGIAAYVLQNLLLLDQVLSYMPFFALLAYIVAMSPVRSEPAERKPGYALRTTRYALVALLALAAAYAAYAYGLMPYRQSRAMFHSANAGDIRKVVDGIKRGMAPYNYAQYTIRSQAVDSMYLEGYFYRDEYRDNPSFREPGELLLSGTRELREKEPFDARVFIREAQMLAPYGPKDPSVYERAVATLREALAIAPDRQEIYYHLAADLARLGKADESIAAAKQAVNLEPGVPRAHLNYALALAILGRGADAEAELDEALRLDPDMSLFLGNDPNTALSIYEAAGRPEKAVALVMKRVHGETGANFNADRYRAALRWYVERKDQGAVLEIARFMQGVPELKDDAEVILDLAGKGMWETIWGL